VREVDGEHLDLENAEAGVYRVEVFLMAHPFLRPNVPWILSNPIFVGTGSETAPPRRFTTIRAQLTPPAAARPY